MPPTCQRFLGAVMSKVWKQLPEGWGRARRHGRRMDHLCSLPGSPGQQPGPKAPGRPTYQWGCGRRKPACDEPEAVGSPTTPSITVSPGPTAGAAALPAASPLSSGIWKGWSGHSEVGAGPSLPHPHTEAQVTLIPLPLTA